MSTALSPGGNARRVRSRPASRRPSMSMSAFSFSPRPEVRSPMSDAEDADLSAMVMTPTTEEWVQLGGKLDEWAKQQERLEQQEQQDFLGIGIGTSQEPDAPEPADIDRKEIMQRAAHELASSASLRVGPAPTPRYGLGSSSSGVSHYSNRMGSAGKVDKLGKTDKLGKAGGTDKGTDTGASGLARRDSAKKLPTLSHGSLSYLAGGASAASATGGVSATPAPAAHAPPPIESPSPFIVTRAPTPGELAALMSERATPATYQRPSREPLSLDWTLPSHPVDAHRYSALTHARSIASFDVDAKESGRGAYGTVRKAREHVPIPAAPRPHTLDPGALDDALNCVKDGPHTPQSPPLIIKYVIKQKILADCWKRHRVLGAIPIEVHVLDRLRGLPYVPRVPRALRPEAGPWASDRPGDRPRTGDRPWSADTGLGIDLSRVMNSSLSLGTGDTSRSPNYTRGHVFASSAPAPSHTQTHAPPPPPPPDNDVYGVGISKTDVSVSSPVQAVMPNATPPTRPTHPTHHTTPTQSSPSHLALLGAGGASGTRHHFRHIRHDSGASLQSTDTSAVAPDVTTGHPNICGLLDFFEDAEFYYLVMPQAGFDPAFPTRQGSDLFDFVDAHPDGLDAQTVRRIFAQVADALYFLHSCGIAHRDIKDENIMLDHRGRVQLIDFGSAAYVRGYQTFDTFSGTLNFAAPEVLRGAKYSGIETDIWALGVLGCVLLCGECPFFNPAEAMRGAFPNSRCDLALKEKVRNPVLPRGAKTSEASDATTSGASDVNNTNNENESNNKQEESATGSPDSTANEAQCKTGPSLISNPSTKTYLFDEYTLGPDEIMPTQIECEAEALKNGAGRIEHAVDLIRRCLEVDPAKRPTIDDVLEHRFIIGSEGWYGPGGFK